MQLFADVVQAYLTCPCLSLLCACTRPVCPCPPTYIPMCALYTCHVYPSMSHLYAHACPVCPSMFYLGAIFCMPLCQCPVCVSIPSSKCSHKLHQYAHVYKHVHCILGTPASSCSLECLAVSLQGIVGLGPAWCLLKRPGPASHKAQDSHPALPCSWSRLCDWRLGSWRSRSPGGWCGRVWSCGGSCRRNRPPTGASCRPTRRASSGRPN